LKYLKKRRLKMFSNLPFSSSILASLNTNLDPEIIEKLKNLKDEENITIEEKKEIKDNIKDIIGLVTFQGQTDSYWKDLEIVGTKVMVISIPSGTFIRCAKNLKEELSSEKVNGKFLILDGLQYKSNDENNPIVYMKV